MIRHRVLAIVAGAGMVAASASAQQPHSTVRIAVGKDRRVAEAPVSERADTMSKPAAQAQAQAPVRVDTVTRTVTVTRTDTVTRVDSVIMPIQIHEMGPFYAGLSLGASFAAPQFTNSDNPGWRVEVPLGMDLPHSPVGFRVNLAYARHTPQSWTGGGLADAQMMNADADLKLRIASITPAHMRVQLYGLAGGSYSRFMNVLETHNDGSFSVGSTAWPSATLDQSWHSGFGWNAGGGFEMGRGRTSFFTEIRFTDIQGVVAPIASIPLVVGMTIR